MVRDLVSPAGQSQVSQQLIRASGPDVSLGIVLSGFPRVWLVGSFYFSGSGDETQLCLNAIFSLTKLSLQSIDPRLVPKII